MGYREQVIADGAVAYWRLGETSGTTANSEIGSFPGTISGGVTLGQPGGVAGSDTAMAFDGSSGKIDIPASITLPVTVSIEAWVRSSFIGFEFFWSNQPTGAFMAGFDSAGKLTLYTSFSAPGTRVIADGQWHHVVITSDGTTTRLYVDGAADGTQSQARGSQTAPATIGWTSLGHRWSGNIDDIAIYPTVLTPAQIANHYAIGLTNVTPVYTYPQKVLADGAVAYWRLDEASGTSLNSAVAGVPAGTIAGGVTLNQPGAVAGNKAMAFNGTTGTISVNKTGIISGAGPCSVEFWAILQGSSNEAGLVGRGGVGSHYQFTWHLGFRLNFYAAGVLIFADPPAPGLTWHHIVGTWDGTINPNGVQLYVDGAQAKQGTAATTSPSSLNAFWFAQATTFFAGSLDEVAIYPTALTPAQIAQHYTLGLRALDPYPALVLGDGASAYWRLGEPSGTSAFSEVGGYTGTISGGVTLNQPGTIADGNPAMAFNGSTGKITSPHPAGALAAAFTIEAWIKRSGTVSPLGLVVSTREGASGGIVLFGIEADHIWAQSPTSSTQIIAGTKVVTDGAWHHLVWTNDGTTSRLYVDGVVDAGPTAQAHGVSTGNVAIAWDQPSGLFFPGLIDDVAIYPTALTPQQIAAHFAVGRNTTDLRQPFTPKDKGRFKGLVGLGKGR